MSYRYGRAAIHITSFVSDLGRESLRARVERADNMPGARMAVPFKFGTVERALRKISWETSSGWVEVSAIRSTEDSPIRWYLGWPDPDFVRLRPLVEVTDWRAPHAVPDALRQLLEKVSEPLDGGPPAFLLRMHPGRPERIPVVCADPPSRQDLSLIYPDVERLWNEGLTIAAIAGTVGRSESSVKSALDRMRSLGEWNVPYRKPRRAEVAR